MLNYKEIFKNKKIILIIDNATTHTSKKVLICKELGLICQDFNTKDSLLKILSELASKHAIFSRISTKVQHNFKILP